ncbi:PRC-barrel domain-containing protein [Billgrantia bachuensis]|uniref:PRC-barrel domain containing protein n=1 Tax=Billgrantia bachuensis TaxID=2717286 RepID=A0ABX0PR31_9GAMM|nr:PRC-barrel domain-containing protein [Halomonas bachuensis]NIC05026.1 PRC-barrel domain containing protein [Halomonas bachuensis]
MQKRLLTIAVAAVSGGLAFSGQAFAEQQENENGQDNGQQQEQNQQQAQSQGQGLYAAEDILDSDVYHSDNPDEDVGDVENILLDNEGKVSALVLNTGGLWGIGGDEVVVDIEHFTLETERDDNAAFGQGLVRHRILVDATEEELENFPTYDEQWFNDERNRRIEDRGAGMRGGVWRTTGAAGTGAVGDTDQDDSD